MSALERSITTTRINGFESKLNRVVRLEKMIYSVREQSLLQDNERKGHRSHIGDVDESQAFTMKNLGEMRTVPLVRSYDRSHGTRLASEKHVSTLV
jgi:hypothetical protein